MRFRKCKSCGVAFKPVYSTVQPVCSPLCALKYSRIVSKKRKEKENREELKVAKEKIKTYSDHINELQKLFNTFIRLRDKGKSCIACGRSMEGRKGDASHYYSVGGNPGLRVDERNCHLGCVPCNREKHGNLIEYGLRLPERIGREVFEKLNEERNKIKKFSIPEIVELKKHYKQKIKELNVNPSPNTIPNGESH